MTDAETRTEKAAAPGRAGQDGASGLPLFYTRPEALRSEVHGSLRVMIGADFGFAARSHAVPINAVEFAAASRHYPIVFAGSGEPPAAIAVLGLRRDRNLFVSADGAWTDDTYVPSYVRRYPFILARNEDASEFTLCLDMASDKVGPDREAALFDGLEPADITRKALEFCLAFQREARESEAILAKLAEHDLLIANEGRFTLPSGEVLTVNDFRIVDEARFNALEDAAFLDLRRSGALAAVYCHLLSMRNWPALLRRAAA